MLDLNPHPSGLSPSWRRIASMSTRRSSVGVGVLNALVYAVGGYDGNSRHCLSSVEVYDPERDIWHQVRHREGDDTVSTFYSDTIGNSCCKH